jgi:alpha-mannosidase
MTRLHDHHKDHIEFVRSRVGSDAEFALTRREFLQTGVVLLSGAVLPRFLADLKTEGLTQELTGKRVYIAPDDHTDLFWTADLETYEKAFLEMLDYYLDLADSTLKEPPEFQSRWNCDGSFWVWVYEHNKTQTDFERLIERVRDGHISVPLNALCVCLGGAPAEAVLRGMYYPGRLERRYNLRFHLAYSIENQTLPLGLGALWAGSGARFSWKGICGCATEVPDPWDREHDIYWWVGLDNSRILMKWNSMLVSNASMGGYAEARDPEGVINYVNTDQNFQMRYPYQIIGAFGYGLDDLHAQTDIFVYAAKTLSTQNLKVIVSNEIDFAQDFEKTYGNAIPSLSVSFGNEWDLDCSALAETSARVKRAVEKLRTAESLATLVCLKQNDFMQGRTEARDLAWMNLGLYWEHDWFGGGGDLTEKRIQWTRKIAGEIEDYVNTLYADALSLMGSMIQKTDANERYFVFNSLSWARTDFADYEYRGTEPAHVVDLESGQDVPSQFVTRDGKRWLRILASNIPPVGYKVFEIRNGAGQSFSREISINGGTIENQFYSVTVDGRGAITSLVDRTNGNRQIVAEVNQLFMNDLGSGVGNLQIENDGPVSVTFLATVDGPVEHTSRITLYRDIDRVEIQNDITQNFSQPYTWSFSFAMQNPNIYHEEVGAVLRARLANDGGHYSPRNARYDWLTLNHFVAINQNDAFGATLSNADCYYMQLGNSTVSELDINTPQISILMGRGKLSQGNDDYFLQRFALQSHTAFNPAKAMRFALEHQNPLATGSITGGDLYPETSYSLLHVDNPNILLWTLKPAEDGLQAGVVARVWNLADEPGDFSLQMNDDEIRAVLSLSHIETPTGSVPVEAGKLVDSIKQQQIKTYAFFPAKLPFLPDTAGPTTIATSNPDAQPTPATRPVTTATPPVSVTRLPSPTVMPAATPAPGRKGCLLGLLDVLLRLVK